MITTQKLVDFLKENRANTSLVNKLKMVYRPYICPFDDLLKLVSPTDSIMDIGCGSGQFLSLIAEFIKPQSLYGIEISQELINNAQQLLGKYKKNITISLNLYNGREFPDSVKNCNVIFLNDVFHHVPRKQQFSFLKELHNKINPGTKLIIKDIDKSNWLVLCNKMHDLILSQEISHEVRFKDLQQMLNSIGFNIIFENKRRMLWYPHFTIIAKK